MTFKLFILLVLVFIFGYVLGEDVGGTRVAKIILDTQRELNDRIRDKEGNNG